MNVFDSCASSTSYHLSSDIKYTPFDMYFSSVQNSGQDINLMNLGLAKCDAVSAANSPLFSASVFEFLSDLNLIDKNLSRNIEMFSMLPSASGINLLTVFLMFWSPCRKYLEIETSYHSYCTFIENINSLFLSERRAILFFIGMIEAIV
jgi:hypothetical protein